MPQRSLDEVVADSEEGYPRNVREAVLTRLLDDGTLPGTTVGEKRMLEDGPALARVLGFGVEDFAYNTQGWCFFAVDAPIDRVAAALAAHRAVERYTPSVALGADAEDLEVQGSVERRDAFVLHVATSAWTVVVQTVHWIQGSDPLLALYLAAELSESLGTRAVAMWDDDFSGAHPVQVERGQRTSYVGDESNSWEDVAVAIYRLGLRVPKCFIASDGASATLHVADPAEVTRADHAVLRVPAETQVGVPHALEKLGMLAQAIASPPTDEADFCGQMIDGLWQQAERLRQRR